MSIIPPSGQKHDLEGIGGASAASLFALLVANPSTTWLTAGLFGKVLFWVLTKFFSSLASMGLVVLNVGAGKLLAAVDRANFDGSMAAADRLIEEIRKTGRELTPEEIKKIDDEVIATFKKFAKMTRRK